VLQRKEYPSDLTEQQWEIIKDLLPKPRRGGRPRTTDVREVINAIFYLNRSGCAWRYLPREFPKWQTVYDYFSRWKAQGLWENICAHLAKLARVKIGREETPSVVIIDSQSAKAHFGEHRGYDGFKKVRGRKRHILVDTLGILHGVKVGPANLADDKPGMDVIWKKQELLEKRGLKAVYADGGYRTWFECQVFGTFKTWPTIIKGKKVKQAHPNPTWKGSKVNVITHQNLTPKRWIVERTIAWFNHYRRLTRDYERKTCNSETMLYLAMTQILLRKLHPS
jgi:putative transposase